MDAAFEQDIELQRNAASYIGELKDKLPRFLFHTRPNGQTRVRACVRAVTTTRLCNLFEPFQEWPQLLDPHLPTLVRPLQDALRESCSSASAKRSLRHNELVQSLDFAVCKLLYTLCKVRGAKVISRFLDSSTANLELVLGSLEAKLDRSNEQTQGRTLPLVSWEEKYVYMLWISHLLFAPFDLSTVGSLDKTLSSAHANIHLPPGLPGIAVRLIHVGLLHLGAASKEREAAVKLLSRLAARPDMVRYGVHDSLFDYALSTLKALQVDPEQVGPYDLIGCLSLLAGLLSTLKVMSLKPYILAVFKNVLSLTTESSSGAGTGTNTAVSRKLMVKNLRILSTIATQLAADPQQQKDSAFADYILEDAIDFLLTSLADKDTPVRQAASKAISVIVLDLDADLAGEVVESVIGSLDENVLWLGTDDQEIMPARNGSNPHEREGKRDLSAVNPLRWHGLVLTLAQLLFQRSAPPSQLPAIINSLVLALGFEQRVASGSSIGGNVRDAANFGIWSIARKYSTEELLRVQVPSVRALMVGNHAQLGSISVIQALAAELVVAATLDPSGNIRRGSSAALQELIGRHPDMVFEGIPIVQVVDYHAVSLRSKAFSKVAIEAARLHEYYWETLLVAMMGWRGLEASDATSRRLAAMSLSSLALVMGSRGTRTAAHMIYQRLAKGRIRDVEKRHGLLLAASALTATLAFDTDSAILITNFWSLLKPARVFNRDDLLSQTRKPELTAEAASELVATLAEKSCHPKDHMEAIGSDILDNCMDSLSLALDRREQPVLNAAARGAKNIFRILDSHTKDVFITEWIRKVDARITAHDTGPHQGYLLGLASVSGELDPARDARTLNRILTTLFRAGSDGPLDDVHARVAALAALRHGIFQTPGDVTSEMVSILKHSLQDYTVDERGDIGSLVRLEALEVVHRLLRDCHFPTDQDKEVLLGQVAVLAGEKLDKLRFYAWNCLQDNWSAWGREGPPLGSLSTVNQASTQTFFSHLLSLLRVPWLVRPILQGVCVSAGAGSESVLQVARRALVQYFVDSSGVEVLSVCAAMLDILRDNLSEDRICVPMLDTWVYLLQSNLLSSDAGRGFDFRRLFVLVQKAHFKSGNVQKLTAAVHLYATLAARGEIHVDVLKKLSSMLLHPLPRVRNAAADALFMSRHLWSLTQIDWSKAPKDLKSTVEEIKVDMIANVDGNTVEHEFG